MTTTSTTLQLHKAIEVSAVLKLANLARSGKEDLLTDKEFLFIADQIQKDFPWLTSAELQEAILKGAKGKYDQDRDYIPINMPTIYRWLSRAGYEPHPYSPQQRRLYNRFSNILSMRYDDVPSIKEWIQMDMPSAEDYLNKLKQV